MLVGLTPSAHAQAGLVAAYGFNEGTGTTTADVSGNANTGTLANATWSAAGKFGKALSFNGANAWSLSPIPPACISPPR